MRPMKIAGRVAQVIGLLALVLLTLTLLPQSASAAAVTKISDHTESIGCEVVDGTTRTQFAVAKSDLAGTQAVARISRDGQTVGEGYGESDWTASTFRAALELTDEEGRVVNTAYLSGTYRAAADGDRSLNKFKDGNIHVIEDHSSAPLSVTDVTLAVDGVTLSGVDCFGESIDGSLSYSNPSSYVSRGTFNADADCKTDNAVDFALYGSPEEMWVTFGYADSGDWSASSEAMNLAAGPFAGTFNLNDGEGPAGVVPAKASLVQNGSVIRRSIDNGTTAVSERWVMTPYLLTVSADGPNAPVTASCTFYVVDATLHVKTNKLDG
jgi:hypothetical protein